VVSEKRKKLDEEKKVKTRNSLLEAAIEVFLLKGYHQTNISDIVAKAVVGQGTFYRNFKSKKDIFESILKIFIDKVIYEFSGGFLNVEQMPSSFDEYKEKSLKASLRVMPIIMENKDIMKLFFRDALIIDKEFEKEVISIFEDFINLAEHYLKHSVKEGFIRDCNTRIVAQSIMGMVIQIIKSWLYGDFPDSEIEDIMIEINNFIFSGIIKT